MKYQIWFNIVYFSWKERVIKLTILPSLFASSIFWSQISVVVMRCTLAPANSSLSSESSSLVLGYKYHESYNLQITEENTRQINTKVETRKLNIINETPNYWEHQSCSDNFFLAGCRHKTLKAKRRRKNIDFYCMNQTSYLSTS